MMCQVILLAIFLHAAKLSLVETAKQQVQLSDSYLPVAMQVIAHITDQMAYEQPAGQSTTSSTTKRPTYTTRPVTTKPVYVSSSMYPGGFAVSSNGWRMSYGLKRLVQTTPYHKPGLYAPLAPPKPNFSKNKQGFILLPFDHNMQYTVIEPQETKTEEPFLSIQEEEVKPLIEPTPESAHLLPPHPDSIDKISSRSDDNIEDELTEENLQYLSPTVRDLIKMAYDPHDKRPVDVWEGVRAGPHGPTPAKYTGSNLRLLLLYDLLSREAKKQRLSDYSGFSPDVMKNLVQSSKGGVREQLRFALSKMVERGDCSHDYANNRAREMVAELANDTSKFSTELNHLQPVMYIL